MLNNGLKASRELRLFNLTKLKSKSFSSFRNKITAHIVDVEKTII